MLTRFVKALLAALTVSLAAGPAFAQDAARTLHQLFAEERGFNHREEPLSASAEGVRNFDNRGGAGAMSLLARALARRRLLGDGWRAAAQLYAQIR